MKKENFTREERIKELTGPLLSWYRRSARDLPWRRTRDPYPIWVSEIMLQQTRVAAVLGYYDRFLSAFPTVESLASAPEDSLLKLWEGLGYYSRARNLQKTAKIITNDLGGRFPTDYAGLMKLPGIGAYTAAAIVSAAFGVPEPAVDGNVLRIVSRITDSHDPVTNPAVRRDVGELLRCGMPEAAEDVRIYNQSAMELGATVCVPNGPPMCGVCPAAQLCLGRIRGTAAELPVRGEKAARRQEELTVYVLQRDDGAVALRRRGERGLLAGLWEFPNVPGALDETAAVAVLEGWHLRAEDWERRVSARHIFTHVEWRMTGYVLRVRGEGGPDFLWADGEAMGRCAVPSAFARFRAEAERLLCAASEEEEP